MKSETPPVGRPTAKSLLVQTWYFINEHEILTRASAIAFSSLSACVPLLAVVLIVLLQILPDITSVGQHHSQLGALMLEQLRLALQTMFPPDAYKVVEEQIQRMQSSPPFGFMWVGILLTLWCASGVYRAMISAMNRIYGVEERRPFWRVWCVSIWMTIVQTAIFVGALLVIIAWPWLMGYMGLDPSQWLLSSLVRWVVIVGGAMLSFALLFHMGPDVEQAHRWVTPGAVFGTVALILSCTGLKLYVENYAHYDATYGSIAGVMIMLLWFYTNALMLLVATEVNRLCHFAVQQCKANRAARNDGAK